MLGPWDTDWQGSSNLNIYHNIFIRLCILFGIPEVFLARKNKGVTYIILARSAVVGNEL